MTVEELAERFLERVRRGEQPQFSEYVEKYPTLADEIREVFPAIVIMEQLGFESAGAGAAARDVASADTAPAPARVGRYEILRRLKEGGMGVVYLGRDPDLGRSVVLKTVRGSLALEGRAVERFRREARIAGRLDHPGICPVLDVVTEEGRDFVVMPFIEGEPLAARIERARERTEVSPGSDSFWISIADQAQDSEAGAVEAGVTPTLPASPTTHPDSARDRGDLRGIIYLVERVARAVHAAHEGGIVHRDLKPANVLIRSGGEPVVLDFGLALDTSESSPRLSREGELLGTPLYMAPEQVEGNLGVVDRRTDVHALGAILYELLTLRTPYEAASKLGILRRILRGDPVSPRKINPAIPRDLAAVCLKALAWERQGRYPTALDLAEDLRRVRTLRPTVAKPASAVGRIWRRARRNPLASGAVAMSVLFALVCLILAARWLATRRTVNHYAAAARVLGAVLRNEKPQPQDLASLEKLLPDEAARRKFLRDPRSSKEWEKLEGILEDLPRAENDLATSFRLLGPRAAVADLRPCFRFEVPEPDGEEWHYRLTISCPELSERTWELVQGADEKGPMAFDLPASEFLEAGREYTWLVRLDAGRHAEYLDLYKPRPARFRVLKLAVRRRLLERGFNSGNEALDRLLRAASLNERRLAADALAVLGEFPLKASEEENALRIFLCAEARAFLEDREGFEVLRGEFRKSANFGQPVD